VHVCPIATPGSAATAYYSDPKGPAGLATDGTDLYWTENHPSGGLVKCALGTKCTSPTVIASDVKSPFGIALGKKEIYITSPANGTVSVFHQ
jgi:hypothetical protein